MLPPKPIRVLVADSHEMMRSGLAIFMDVFEDLELVGEAKNGTEALYLCAQLQPDVVLMSLRLPPSDGLLITRMICQNYPQIHVIILTSSNHIEDAQAALLAGASSYIMMEISVDDIAESIRAAAN